MSGRIRTGRLCCALGMILAGTVVVASKLAVDGLPPLTAACLRYGLAAAILVPWTLLRHGPPRPDRRDAAILVLQALAGSLGFAVPLLLGLRHTSGANAAVLSGALPVVTGLMAALVLRESTGRRLWAGIALAGLGGAVLGLGGRATPDHLQGDALVLLAVLGEAAFVLLNRGLRRPLPAVTVSAVMCALGCLITAPLALMEPGRIEAGPALMPAILAVAWHALGPTVGGFVLWYAGTARLGGAAAAPFTALMPASGLLLSALVLDEPLAPDQWAAMALVAAAILLGSGGKAQAP